MDPYIYLYNLFSYLFSFFHFLSFSSVLYISDTLSSSVDILEWEKSFNYRQSLKMGGEIDIESLLKEMTLEEKVGGIPEVP